MVIFCTGAELFAGCNERVADLMVGDDVFFVIGKYRVLLLIACDDDLDALLQGRPPRLSCAFCAPRAAPLRSSIKAPPEAPEAIRAGSC